MRSSWGVAFVVSCLHELCANSAIGSISAQIVGCVVVQGRRYCSSQAFILSVWPSVLGWNAVEKFCWIPSPWAIALENPDVNLGSLSEMMRLGIPNQGTMCCR